MTDLIGLAGYARVGKDSVAQALVVAGFRRRAFADPIRDMLYRLNPQVFASGLARSIGVAQLVDLMGWEHAKTFPEVRELLQRLGTDAAKPLFGDDCWIRVALDRLSGPTVVADVRFPDEADAIHAAGGQVWRVHRHGVGPANQHVSETAMDDYHGYDWHVWNTGTLADLHDQVLAAVA